jgi:two-component system OmpR family response regulator
MDGLVLWQSRCYYLVILDLITPNLADGEVLRRLRDADWEVLVMIVTAANTLAYRLMAFELGADNFLSKPFSFAELRVRVHALLRRASAKQDPCLKVGEITLNLLSRTMVRHQHRIDLTERECFVLEFLMRHPDEVVSREAILQRVWPGRSENVENMVDVYIRKLRTKIEDRGSSRVIRTVRGQGYVFSTQPAASRYFCSSSA